MGNQAAVVPSDKLVVLGQRNGEIQAVTDNACARFSFERQVGAF